MTKETFELSAIRRGSAVLFESTMGFSFIASVIPSENRYRIELLSLCHQASLTNGKCSCGKDSSWDEDFIFVSRDAVTLNEWALALKPWDFNIIEEMLTASVLNEVVDMVFSRVLEGSRSREVVNDIREIEVDFPFSLVPIE